MLGYYLLTSQDYFWRDLDHVKEHVEIASINVICCLYGTLEIHKICFVIMLVTKNKNRVNDVGYYPGTFEKKTEV